MEKVPESGHEGKALNDTKARMNAQIIARLMFSDSDKDRTIAAGLFDGQKARNKALDRWGS